MKIKLNVGAWGKGWEKSRLPVLIVGGALFLASSFGDYFRESEYPAELAQKVMNKARGNDGVYEDGEARGLAEAIGYKGPLSDANGRLFRIYRCTHYLCNPAGFYGALSVDGERYFLDKQRLEDYLRSD